MYLKNVSKEIVGIRWNGTDHNVEPGKAVDVRANLGAKTDQEEICIAEKFEKETGKKLLRINMYPPEIKPIATPKPEEKTQPEPIKEEKSDGKSKNTKKGGKK